MNDTLNKKRNGCKDVWNAFMLDGANYSDNDIPFCPTTATDLPKGIITWEEAKAIYKKHRIKGDLSFQHCKLTEFRLCQICIYTKQNHIHQLIKESHLI